MSSLRRDQRLTPSLRVLVAEGDRDAREVLRLLLSLLGCRVDAAADGLEAVRQALQNRPDLGLIDLKLPRLDGFAVARRLREAYGPRPLPLAYSAYDEDDAGGDAREAGFDALLVKPVEYGVLARWLAEPTRGPG